jgi:hypothetical protein
MSWEDVYNLLETVGGKLELASADEIKSATAEGPGDRDTQIAVAQVEYARHERKREKRKEAEHGQTAWQFG